MSLQKVGCSPAVELDIDDLSSGEKAVIALFLPFVESQINVLLENLQGDNADPVKPVALIDEPELHLHPALQIALMAYVRQLAQQGTAQFILATHSTTIMDELEDDELYLLAPPSPVGGGNQLSKVSATTERLEIVRELTGSTYVVTRCRPIIFVEGERPGARVVSDQRVVEMLVPEARGWVLVPAHGRNQVVRSASELRQPYLTELPGMSVFALVDHDQGTDTDPDFVITWAVCMIENLLLDPEAIWSLLDAQRELVGIASVGEVRAILERFCQEREDEEIRLRVRRKVAQPYLALPLEQSGDVAALSDRARTAAEAHGQKVGGEAELAKAVETSREEVRQILAKGEQLERFHGKELLKRFYDEFAKRAGWNYAMFCYQLAAAVKPTSRLRNLVECPVRKIRQFVPVRLSATLIDCSTFLVAGPGQVVADDVRASVVEARNAWEQGTEDPGDRTVLRQRSLEVARLVKQAGNKDLYERLLADLVELGTG